MRVFACSRFILALASIPLFAGCEGGGDVPAGPIDPPDELGAFAIGYTELIVVDEARNGRELPVSVWYPVDEEDAADEPLSRYPLDGAISLPSALAVDDLPVSSNGRRALLIFSHGYGGINTQSTQLMEALASHGFIVASVSHTGNTTGDSSDDRPAEKRVPDVSVVIDRMFERSNTAGDAFEGRIDQSRVGVLGHSFGGQTALGTVAGWAGAAPDPRVSAIGVIAGGVGEDDFPKEALAAVRTPTLLFVGTLDPPALEKHRYVFANMPNAAALFNVEVEGANHTHFANVCDIGNLLLGAGITQDLWPGIGAEGLLQPYDDTCTDDVFPIDEAQRIQNKYMVAHFRRYLLGQVAYERFLSTEHADEVEPTVSFEAQ